MEVAGFTHYEENKFTKANANFTKKAKQKFICKLSVWLLYILHLQAMQFSV